MSHEFVRFRIGPHRFTNKLIVGKVSRLLNPFRIKAPLKYICEMTEAQPHSPRPMVVYDRPDRVELENTILAERQPAVLKGLVNHWPVVKAARESDQAATDHLLSFDRGQVVKILVGDPSLHGRIFYRQDMKGFNFARQKGQFATVLRRLMEVRDLEDPPAIAVQSVPIPEILPGFDEANSLEFFDGQVIPRIWIGNAIRVAAHYDPMDNIACVAAGRRRFTLFPPEQLPNLYVGPLDVTPAGAAISMVELENPDFNRFPKYRQALDAALFADLEPGDAIYIPTLWWHHVQSLDGLNVLVNYWWDRANGKSHQYDSPFDAMLLAMLHIRDLPPAQRDAWNAIFNHYVFLKNGNPGEHLPEQALGLLGNIDPAMEKGIRKHLLERQKQSLRHKSF